MKNHVEWMQICRYRLICILLMGHTFWGSMSEDQDMPGEGGGGGGGCGSVVVV